MKPFRLMHLLQHITEDYRCPECNTALSPEQIEVESADENSASMIISCHNCDAVSKAHMVIGMRDHADQIEASHHGNISLTEMLQAAADLDGHCGSITELFAKK